MSRFDLSSLAGPPLREKTFDSGELTILFKNEFGLVMLCHATGLIKFSWLPASGSMEFEHFRKTMLALSDIVVARQTKSLLSDLRHFLYRAPVNIALWNKQILVPRHNRTLKRHAWLVSEAYHSLPESGRTYRKSEERYLSRWFTDEAEAMAWATSGSGSL